MIPLTLTLKSCIFEGVYNALIGVTIGPSVPATTMVWPSFRVPFTRQMSMVVPMPGMAFTSRTVACSSSV